MSERGEPGQIIDPLVWDALPEGVIVRDALGKACQKIDGQWRRIGHATPFKPYGPVTVLWEPPVHIGNTD